MSKGLVAETIEAAKAQTMTKRRAAADQLRELLRRNDRPQAGDGVKLSELADTLGIHVNDLPTILELAQRLDEYEGLIAEEPDMIAAQRDANAAITEIMAAAQAERERIAAKLESDLEAPRAKLGAAEYQRDRIRRARRWVENAQRNWRMMAEGTGTIAEWFKMQD